MVEEVWMVFIDNIQQLKWVQSGGGYTASNLCRILQIFAGYYFAEAVLCWQVNCIKAQAKEKMLLRIPGRR
jgi:hypothetical protein